MGSYLTIVNDTPYTWQCKVGPDTIALKIGSILFGVLGGAVIALAIAGAALALISVALIPVALIAATLATLTAGAAAVVGTVSLSSFLLGAPIREMSGMAVVEGLPVASLVSNTGIATADALGGSAAGEVTAGAVGMISSGIAGVTAFGVAVLESMKEKLHIRGYDTILPGKKRRYGKMTLSLWVQSVCIRTNTKGPTVVLDTLLMRPIFSGSTANSNRDHRIKYWLEKNGVSSYVIGGKSKKAAEKKRALEQHDENIQYFQLFPNGTVINKKTGLMYQY